jgi:succinoglycan biosynthesis transport protein ExoP
VALPSNSFTSFAPGSSPSEGEKQSLPGAGSQASILPPTDAPAGISESTSAPPPTQSVTVVVSPSAQPAQTSSWLKWTALGAFLGLAIGTAAGWYYHTKLPGEFESVAKLTVTGPSAANDADAQIAILKSKAVLASAASKLDEQRPWQMPPDQDASKRVSFLEKGLAVSPELGGAGTTLNVSFRGPHPADTPKYLRTVVDAYKADLAGRKAGEAPAPRPAPNSAPDTTEAERARLHGELAALTKDDAATITKRIDVAQAMIDSNSARVKKVEADLAKIRAAGSTRRERLAVMEELGIKSERPEVPAAALAEAKLAEESLRSLQSKKAELGQRLGPDHRDMVSLDEQIAVMKDRIAKAVPAQPAGPDELEKRLKQLESEKALVAARAGEPIAALASDKKLLEQVNALQARIDALPAPKNAAPAPKETVVEKDVPTTFSVNAIVPTTSGERVSPPWAQSMVPGGAIGLMAGAFLGLLRSLFSAPKAAGRKFTKPYKPMVSPVARTSSPAVPITSGPKLAVPVFANVPKIADSPVEKKSGSGWSPKLVAFSKPNSVEAEVFRIARRELTNSLHNRGHQVIPVTSPGEGDGKSLVAANLAMSLAQSGKRVVLVDCDLKRAKIQELFRLTRLGDSLKSIMSAEVDLRMAVRSTEVPNLFLLPAGRHVEDSLDLLSRPKFRELIAELKASYEYVILDSPGTDEAAEFGILAGAADGVVMVVRNAPDAPARSERGKNAVIAAGSRVVGAIVNAAPAPTAPTTPAAERPKALAMA